MTEEVALDTEVSNPNAGSSESQQEEMLPKSRVEELVKKAKLKGRDSMTAELEALQAENAKLKAQGSMGGMAAPQIDPDALKAEIMNDFRKQLQNDAEARAKDEMEREAKKIADTYHAKMSAGRDQFENFDEIMADFNPAAFPNLVYLVSQVENTPAVMHELMTNPSKWATIAVMSERDPAAAQRMIGKISASIQVNNQAKANEREVAPPLGRLSSSPTGQDNGQPNSVRDFKRMFRG